jgi:hypothetical protein
MGSDEGLIQLVKKISHAVGTRRYSDLEPIIESVFAREDKLAVLVDLAQELGATASKIFFLSGLSHLIQMRDADYTTLLELAKGRGIALYHIVTFLLVDGRARTSAMRRLCPDLSEIQKQEHLRRGLLQDGRSPNEDRMNQRMYDELKVPPELLARFRAKFAE